MIVQRSCRKWENISSVSYMRIIEGGRWQVIIINKTTKCFLGLQTINSKHEKKI